MSVESATYISELNAAYPDPLDQRAEGDNHIRLIKATIKATFPNIAGAVTLTHTQLNALSGTLPAPSGTRLLFQQTAAPTGWTKVTDAAYNDAALKLTTGTVATGGADAFTTVFGAGKLTASCTLLVTQMPPHSHGGATGLMNTNQAHAHTIGSGSQFNYGNAGVNYTYGDPIFGQGYAAAGIGGMDAANIDHQHVINAEGGGQGHSHGLTMNIKYAEFIIAQKD